MLPPQERMSQPAPERTSAGSADDEQVMETPRHWQQMLVLVASLQEAWDQRDDFYVAGRMPLRPYENHSWGDDLRDPDVLVAVGVSRHERRAWIVSEEGKAPDVVIELVSPSTETADRVFKFQLYATVLGIGEYVIFDPMSGRLDGYELDPESRSYVAQQPDPRVDFPSGPSGSGSASSGAPSGESRPTGCAGSTPTGRR